MDESPVLVSSNPTVEVVLEALAARDDAPDRDDDDAFVAWARAADDDFGGPVPLSRFLAALRAMRPDLLDAFPQVPGCDVTAFRTWARVHGPGDNAVDGRFMPPEVADEPAEYTQAGVNLAGFLTAELGVGEIARRIAAALEAASVPFVTTTFARTANRTSISFGEDAPARFDTNIVCVNADSWGRFVQHVGPRFFAGRYTIAVWFWETSVFPSMFHSAFRGVDEVWTASEYAASAIRDAAPAKVPVRVLPIPILEPTIAIGDMRARLDLPTDRQYMLTSFDHHSVAERKNPIGAIEAFRNAFPNADGPMLVVKSINGDRHPEVASAIREAAADRPDIVLRDGYLDAHENMALLAQSTAFVSLHRAEGYGLNIADAMALGVPVVATAYGGNLEFADEDCWLVPSREIRVGEGHFPYLPDAQWGDPDLAVATNHLQAIAADRDAALGRAARSRARVLATFTARRTGDEIRNRIAAARARRAVTAAATGGPAEDVLRRLRDPRAVWRAVRRRAQRFAS